MKIKYKRIIKIFIFILLISANIYSYAAVSSDGSAFVTGEEFNKAVTDFNRRLTTFQAGINSKIDSQVSSYLDRNGIWNASEQITNPVPVDSFGWYADTAVTERSSYVWVDGVKFYNMGKDHAYKLSSYDMNEVIVNKIQKHGLANVVINFSQHDKTITAFTAYNDPGTTIHQDWFGSSIISDEYITVTNAKGTEDRYNINWATYFPAPTAYRIDYPKQLSAYIFVDVNDQVSFRFEGKYYELQIPLTSSSSNDWRINITDWSIYVY